MGFDPPSWFPDSSPSASQPVAPLGVSCPFNARGYQSPRPRRLPGLAPRDFARESAGGAHPASYGAALGFPNLSAAFSSSHPPTIFRWVAFVGFALQGFVPVPQPRPAHRRPAYPLDVPPTRLRVLSFPRREHLGAHPPLPRMSRRCAFDSSSGSLSAIPSV